MDWMTSKTRNTGICEWNAKNPRAKNGQIHNPGRISKPEEQYDLTVKPKNQRRKLTKPATHDISMPPSQKEQIASTYPIAIIAGKERIPSYYSNTRQTSQLQYILHQWLSISNLFVVIYSIEGFVHIKEHWQIQMLFVNASVPVIATVYQWRVMECSLWKADRLVVRTLLVVVNNVPDRVRYSQISLQGRKRLRFAYDYLRLFVAWPQNGVTVPISKTLGTFQIPRRRCSSLLVVYRQGLLHIC